MKYQTDDKNNHENQHKLKKNERNIEDEKCVACLSYTCENDEHRCLGRMKDKYYYVWSGL